MTVPDLRLPLLAAHAFAQPFGAPAAATCSGEAAPAARAPMPGSAAAVDVHALAREWAALRSPEDIERLARRHGLTRTQALRLAPPRFALRVDEDSAREVLRAAAGSGTPLAVQVGHAGAGASVRSTGSVRRVEVDGPWLLVHGPGLCLRLREDLVDQAWLVRTPTSDGLVTSLELFDLLGETLATFQGQRLPGRPEPCAWRRIADRLAADPAWADSASSSTAC